MDQNFPELCDFDLENTTLPSLLNESTSPLSVDPRNVPSSPIPTVVVPFSPPSPVSSPGRPKTMKEYEEELVKLKWAHYGMKLRVFFMEQNHFDPNVPKDLQELRSVYMDLRVEHETMKKDLANKEDLLLNTYRAFDAQTHQLEKLKKDHEEKTQVLQNKIESLERELKEYQIKFMETSVQLDDTNAMYAITFGLGSKPQPDTADDVFEDKIRELEDSLEKEKHQVLRLEGVIEELNSKGENDRQNLHRMHEKLVKLEDKLQQAVKEKVIYEESLNKETCQTQKHIKNMQKYQETIAHKETEIKSLKSTVSEMEQKVLIIKKKIHEKEQLCVEARCMEAELHKQVANLQTENSNLHSKVKSLQHQLVTFKSSSREQTSERKSGEEERANPNNRVRELQREIQDLKNNRPRYPGGVEAFIQKLIIENKCLKKEAEELKTTYKKLTGHHYPEGPTREEVTQNIDVLLKEMTSDKDILISELKRKVEELTDVVNKKEQTLQDYKTKSEQEALNAKGDFDREKVEAKNLEDSLVKNKHEKEVLQIELEEKRKEVESLKNELKKRTYNLQGLVNTELWGKNREIEKLNKLCERQRLEILSLQKQVREYPVTLLQSNVSPVTVYNKDKENVQPMSDSTVQLQILNEEKRVLMRKVEELQARLLNTPERDPESLLVQTLRSEKDQAEKLRKDAVNACMLLTTRLQELADFLDSLLPSLCGKKHRVVKQAVERSRELSRSLSLAAEESTLQNLHCSAWSDLQPSLYLPLLPDVSTVDFWSGDESHEETFPGGEEKSVAEVVQNDGETSKCQVEKSTLDSDFLRSVFSFDEQQLIKSVENNLLSEIQFPSSLVDLTEGSLVDSCSEQNNLEKTTSNLIKFSPEVKSANIGKITLTSRKKDSKILHTTIAVDDKSMSKEKEADLSENETWSEPDRDVSYARMGLKEEATNVNKCAQLICDDTSETADSAARSPSSRRASEVQRLQRKMRSLEQVNEALRSELLILHQLTPPALTKQDKTTSIEISRQSSLCVPSHLLEEIKNQREKLEASLFHNDYIRRQLESTVSSLRKSPAKKEGDDQESASLLVRLKEVTNQLEQAESELSKLRLEKENWLRKIDNLQCTLEQTSSDLTEKQCALVAMEEKAAETLKEEEKKCNEKCSQFEIKILDLEQKFLKLQKEKEHLSEKIVANEQQIVKFKSDIENYEQEDKKNKQVLDELNVKVQQISKQKEELQSVIKEQEQLLSDAERERGELATQLIARDRQVSELQKRLSHVELTSNELEAALRSQLDIATHQCDQYEAKLRDLDNNKERREREKEALVEMQSRLDAARFAHSEAVLQYTRLANDNIRLQQELRRRQQEPNEQIERIKSELERRVAELEAVNAELGSKLASLDVKHMCSDYETDAGSSVGVVGSPRRPPPPALAPLAVSPHHYTSQRSRDLTSDYLSDQEMALTSPQLQTQNMWFPPSSPHSHASASPDLGIESDHGRFSSLDTHASKSTAISLRGTPVKDLVKLEEENTQLRRNLQKTRHALEETLAQLTAANQHKRQYEVQLSAANQQKAKVERAICRQINKTQSILKKAKVNLEEDWKNKNH